MIPELEQSLQFRVIIYLVSKSSFILSSPFTVFLWKGCFFILLLSSLLANIPGKLATDANEIAISVGKCDPRTFESSKPHLTVWCVVCTLYSFETCLFIQCNIYLKSICPKVRHWLMKLPTSPPSAGRAHPSHLVWIKYILSLL